MVEHKFCNENSNFKNMSVSIILTTSRDVSGEIHGDMNKWDFFFMLYNVTCLHLDDLRNMENQYFLNGQYMMYTVVGEDPY